MVLLIHGALRRDLDRLCGALRSPALDSARARQLRAHWQLVSEQLHHHHTTEDQYLWPLVREKLAGRPDGLAVIDTMEAQHRTLSPSGDAVERMFGAYVASAAEADELATQLDALRTQVLAHLDDEEAQAFPLIDDALNDDEFASFEKATAKSVGMRGATRFFPWILDGASQDDRKAAVRVLPPPIRAVCRYRWIPPVRAPARGPLDNVREHGCRRRGSLVAAR
jgi:hypothetical protein